MKSLGLNVTLDLKPPVQMPLDPLQREKLAKTIEFWRSYVTPAACSIFPYRYNVAVERGGLRSMLDAQQCHILLQRGLEFESTHHWNDDDILRILLKNCDFDARHQIHHHIDDRILRNAAAYERGSILLVPLDRMDLGPHSDWAANRAANSSERDEVLVH